jgi:hypothetical protein
MGLLFYIHLLLSPSGLARIRAIFLQAHTGRPLSNQPHTINHAVRACSLAIKGADGAYFDTVVHADTPHLNLVFCISVFKPRIGLIDVDLRRAESRLGFL